VQFTAPVVKQIDRYRKHYLWSGGDINRKGSCLAGDLLKLIDVFRDITKCNPRQLSNVVAILCPEQ
jgi:hypothetical protein